MVWNWQQPDWPRFTWDVERLTPLEQRFLQASGFTAGAFVHLDRADRDLLTIELISNEAVKTAEIEGERLDRDSLQSSLRRQFGLTTDARRIPPAEQGMAKLMTGLYRTFAEPLTHEALFTWQRLLTNGRQDLHDVGRYRTHAEPMQVISGRIDAPTVHFEAPPSTRVSAEMEAFVAWFNRTAPTGAAPLPPLTRAGIAHLYFVCVHPFEDGNGRIARALAEKATAQSLGRPTLIALAHQIEQHRKDYYLALERANKDNEITDWLEYFALTMLDAQSHTLTWVRFLIAKTKFYDRLRGRLNPRQEKVTARLFREGPDGFKGGLSAENYRRLTQTSPATATRDLADLVEKGALTRSGERKHTRYRLNIDEYA